MDGQFQVVGPQHLQQVLVLDEIPYFHPIRVLFLDIENLCRFSVDHHQPPIKICHNHTVFDP